MAKRTVTEAESRAWELFAASIKVGCVPTITPEHLASECFKAVAVFEAVADEQPTNRKGEHAPH